MRWRPLLLTVSAAAALVSQTAAAQIPTAVHTPTATWVTLTSPQEVSIPAGKSAIVELRFTISPKLHINSHTPTSETLIPTRLAVTEVPGMKISAIDFPAGQPFTFAIDPTTKLDVYTGEFVLKAHVNAQPGSHLLEGVLRYQACDNAACYPPKTLPVAISVFAR